MPPGFLFNGWSGRTKLHPGIKKDQFLKAMGSYAIEVPVANRIFLCSTLIGSWIRFNIAT